MDKHHLSDLLTRKGLTDLQRKVFFFLQTRNALISLIHWFVLKGFLDLMKDKEDI